MKRLLLTLALLICLPCAALAAIASVGDLTANSCSSITSSTTLVCTTNATLEAGNVAVVWGAKDNVGSTDADHSEVTNVTDSAGNTYTKLCEFTNGQGTGGNGITVFAWITLATTQLTSGGTITITFADAIVAKAANAQEFTVGAALQLAGTCQTEAVDGSGGDGLGSMAVTGLSTAETLFMRLVGHESNSATDLTVTSNYTTLGITRADNGTNAASARTLGEFRIEASSDGDTSDPTLTTSFDTASIFVALRETAAAGTRRPVSPIIF